jgi:hypothetical protein
VEQPNLSTAIRRREAEIIYKTRFESGVRESQTYREKKMGKGIRCFSYALVGVALMLATAQTALAHRDPPLSTSTGVSISLTAFRADQVTPIGGGAINECETIYYQATLAPAAGAAAIESGTLTIQTPDLVNHDVTPATGIPCLGGTFNDPNSATVGQCAGSAPSLTSAMVQYVSSFPAGTCTPTSTLTANAIYAGGIAHNGTTDQAGVGAQTPFQSPVVCCPDDGLACNGIDHCDPAVQDGEHLGSCVPGTPVICNSDGNACNGPETCTEPGGTCVSGPPVVCNDDGNACNGPETCDPTDGSCDSGPPVVCNDDGNACNGPETCDPTDGSCDSGPAVVCDDPVCTACNPANGLCDLPADPLPPECVPSDVVCRTPGFWGTHGGIEKGGPNITQAVLDETGPLSICGVTISTTDLTPTSAIEAICVVVKGETTVQLARQLTAAALNCGVTKSTTCGGGGQTAGDVCGGVTSIEDIFDACNTACANGEVTASLDGGVTTFNCIDALDCFNNGGTGLDSLGVCTGDSGCHERNGDGCIDLSHPGPASSPKKCNDARKDTVSIFP